MTGMEAALASAVLKGVGQKLVSLIKSEFASINGLEQDLCDLRGIHEEIMTCLSLVQYRSIETDPRLRWVIKLKDVAYDINDLVHAVELKAEKHKICSSGDKNTAVHHLQAKIKSVPFQKKIAGEINNIKVRYDAIVAQRRDANTIYQSLQLDQNVQGRNKTTREQTLLCNAGESKILARDKLKTKIVSKLVECDKGEDGCIISIVGLAGSGKTTIAQHICQDVKIKENFNATIYWVHVSSQEFSMEKLTCKLFEAITKKKSDCYTAQYMVDTISRELHGKKFLLVLDDAWHDKRQDWKLFMNLLNSGASENMILLTTRDQNVARVVESNIIFDLACLTDPESWTFFLNSCGWAEEDLNNDLIQVGKDIVKKCGGVPLAIKSLGGVLREKTGINTWRAIRDSNLWDVEDTEGLVFASLKLSYIHLKDHLKQCYVFCSIFPKGYQIKKDHLIEQWMAQGFIKLIGEEQPEDIGSEYFVSLVKAGFFHEDKPRWFHHEGLVYKMHDLIHDLARYCLQNEVVTSLPKNVATGYTQKCRYLCLTSGTEKVNMGLFEKVRALYVSDGNVSFNEPAKKGCYIHSVVVDNENFTPFPAFILKFKYLGYLELHNVKCINLPEAISACWNLQSLHLIRCKGFVNLPESVGKLKKLRTIGLDMVYDLESLPQSVGDCLDLQSLQIHSCCKLREIPKSIGKIENLRLLQIIYCTSLHEVCFEASGKFKNLDKIIIANCPSFQHLPSTPACLILRTLNLSKTNITMLPEWVNTIVTLECIDLEHCEELLELPKGISNLERLAVLNIEGCIKLHCMPSGLGQLIHLEKLCFFVIGCHGDDARISELEKLDKISGDLAIRNIQYLKDPGEAQKAYLNRKNSIRCLTLDWSLGDSIQELVTDTGQDLGVFEAFEAPSKIEKLCIYNYRGLCLPKWMRKQTDYSRLEGIVLNEPADPCQFLHLTRMILEEIPNLKHMKGLVQFPLLTYLELFGLLNLEELCTTSSSFEIGEDKLQDQDSFPVLSHLLIGGCPKLKVKPHFPPSLSNLHLSKSNEQLLSTGSFSCPLAPVCESSSHCSGHSAVPRLKKLAVITMTGSASGWEFLQYLPALEDLSIYGSDDLTQLPESMRSLTSLQRLRIEKCLSLGMLPEWLGELHFLRDLTVFGTPMIDSLPQSIEHLTSLVTLQISGWDNLKQLPDAFQNLTSLKQFILSNCCALTVMPECIGQLSALQQLSIRYCPALQCLPGSIQRLTSLHYLIIHGCPCLARRYKQEVGPNWNLISHIPNVYIYNY